MGQVHLAYRRPPQHFLLVVLPDQYRQHLDQHAPAAEQHDRRTSTANEVHAVYDVYHACSLLLHVQQLLVRIELLLFPFRSD